MPNLHKFKSPTSLATVLPAAWTGCTRMVFDVNARSILLEYETYESHADAYGGVRSVCEVKRVIGPDEFDQFVQEYRAAFLAITRAADDFIAPELPGCVRIDPGPPQEGVEYPVPGDLDGGAE